MRRPAGWVRAFLCGALATAVDAVPAPGAAEPSPPDPDALAAAVARALDLQRDLIRDRSQDSRSWSHFDLPDEVLWLAGLLCLGLLLYAFRDMIPVWGRGRASEWLDAGGDGEAGPGTVDRKMAEADRLAGEGRFADAMHALLLQSLAEIRSRVDARMADSLTSREILRRIRLSAQGAAALREIILSVEWTYFGEHPAAASDYGRCRRHFEELGRSLAGEAA